MSAVICPSFESRPTRTVDDQPEPPRSAPNQKPSQAKQRESNVDVYWPIFSMYSKISKEEDNELAERWQKDADGILIFVSPCVGIPTQSV
jgi:hypothetical protein